MSARWVAPRVATRGIGEHGKQGRRAHRSRDFVWREKRKPTIGISRRQGPFPGFIVLANTTEVFKQVSKCQKRRTGGCLGPVQEDASVAVRHDVAGIEIEVANRIGNFGVGSFGESVLQVRSEGQKFVTRQCRRRFDGLPLHEFGHDFKERLDEFLERTNTRVATTRVQQMQCLSD